MKCGMITHSTKETGQQKEQWKKWGLQVTGKWGRLGVAMLDFELIDIQKCKKILPTILFAFLSCH